MGANSSRPDDLIGPDIDPVGDHDDLMSMSTESADSGVSLKSDQSKAGMILFEDSSPLSSEQQQRPHSAGTMESDQMESRMSMGNMESIESSDFDVPFGNYNCYRLMRTSAKSTDSGVSIRSDSSNDHITNFSHRMSMRNMESIESSDFDVPFGNYNCYRLIDPPKCTASTESGSVSIQSDGSQGCTERFEDTPPPPTKRKNSLKNFFKRNPSRQDK